jgi:hypothetical protein
MNIQKVFKGNKFKKFKKSKSSSISKTLVNNANCKDKKKMNGKKKTNEEI